MERLIRVGQVSFVCLVFCFIYLPIVSLIAFSFNSNRFPSLPWTGFSLHWYNEVFADPSIIDAFVLSILIAVSVSVTATLLGFLGAYMDYRWRFTGDGVGLAACVEPELEQAAWNLGCGQTRTIFKVVVPHCLPAIIAALLITTALSFDEFMIAWFVSGVDVTLPVRILTLLQGQVSASINAIGSIVFAISLILISSALAIIVWSRK